MDETSSYERIVIDRYEFRGFHACRSVCGLEIIKAPAGKTVVIAYELEDNPGTSITNAFEILATAVCSSFGIDAASLVWVEHYTYPVPGNPNGERGYDLVSFEFERGCVGNQFHSPSWHLMTDPDWRELGLEPREAAHY